MNRIKIEGSSNIAEVGYNAEILTLEILFNNGKIYQYWPVTNYAFKKFMEAESKGSFFAKNFRKNPDVNFRKVDPLQSDQ